MYIIPLFYYTCKKKRPVSKNFFRTPQGDGGRLPLFRSTESCELAGPLPGFPLPGRKEARFRGRTAPFLRGDSGQCWFIQKGRGRFAEELATFIVYYSQNSGSILWNIDYEFFTSPRLPVIPRQSSDWRGNSPVEWDLGTMSAYALRRNRWRFVCESIRSTFQPGDFHAGDIGHWFRMTSCARTCFFDREMEARCRPRIAIPFSTGCAAPFRGRLFADRRGNLPMRYGRGETAA